MPQPKRHADHAARQASYRNRMHLARAAEQQAKGLPAYPAIASMPGWVRWNGALTLARGLVEQTLAEMQEYYADRSECWQDSERGAAHEERMASVEAAVDALSELSW